MRSVRSAWQFARGDRRSGLIACSMRSRDGTLVTLGLGNLVEEVTVRYVGGHSAVRPQSRNTAPRVRDFPQVELKAFVNRTAIS